MNTKKYTFKEKKVLRFENRIKPFARVYIYLSSTSEFKVSPRKLASTYLNKQSMQQQQRKHP